MGGGKQLRELIKNRGFKLVSVARAIGVSYETMRAWNQTAPIDKLFGISAFTGIHIYEVIECFRPKPTETNMNVNQGDAETDRSTQVDE